MPIVDEPTEPSEEVLDSVKSGQEHAIAAVRTFVDTVEKTLTGEQTTDRRDRVLLTGLDRVEHLLGRLCGLVHDRHR